MPFLERLHEIIRTPLISLGGVPVTLGSLLTCVLIFLVSLLLARLADRGLRRALTSRGRSPGMAAALGKIVWYAVVAVGTFVSLDTLGLNLTALLAGSAVLLVGIGFGLQNIAQNFISGVILLIERPVKEGDFVRVGDIHGTVRAIGLRATHVVSRDEVTVIVPNSEFATAQIINYSVPTEATRITVRVGVAYGSDVPLVARLLEEVAANEPNVLHAKPVEVRFDNFGDSSLDFDLLAWIADPRQDAMVRSRLRFAIDQAFRDNDVTIPFPQRDLHIVSNPAGVGERRKAG